MRLTAKKQLHHPALHHSDLHRIPKEDGKQRPLRLRNVSRPLSGRLRKHVLSKRGASERLKREVERIERDVPREVLPVEVETAPDEAEHVLELSRCPISSFAIPTMVSCQSNTSRRWSAGTDGPPSE